MGNYKYILVAFVVAIISCSPKINDIVSPVKTQPSEVFGDTLISFNKLLSPDFHYFANGHLANGNYPFKVLEKDGKMAGEIVRASDARIFTGQYHELNEDIRIADGNRFSIDVYMDHIGSFTLKLEESLDGGPTTSISITVKNTEINKWETLIFDYKDAILGGPTYPKIAIFTDLYLPLSGKDMYNYFTNIVQLSGSPSGPIKGDKEQAVKIVILGSSTAAGTGPSETRNAWVNRYRRQLQALNGHHQIINLAVGGYTTYHLLPSKTEVNDERPKPDMRHNVSMAISLNPDAVIINLPSNDTSKGFTLAEQLENYHKIKNALDDAKIPVWVSTPQGRDMEKDKRLLHKVLKDSTFNMFGRKTLDFYTDLAGWDGRPAKAYDCGDGVHLNDEGHFLLFEEVLGKEIITKTLEKKAGIERKDLGYSRALFREGHALIWQDEFDGDRLDESTWSHELGDGCPSLCGWGNAEKVWYKPENTQVKDGKLTITAKPDSEHEGYWSSSRIVTRDRQEFKYGRIDIRAKLPETKGLWPALWLLGSNRAAEGWPYCGEIDIMEERGQIPWVTRGTVFYKGSDDNMYHKGAKTELQYGNLSDRFHLYSIEWTKTSIKFFLDDQLFTERKFADLENLNHEDNPFHKPFYMLINLAVGGNYLGYPDETSVFPQTFEIDYVRHYVADKYYYCPKVEEKVTIMPKKDKLWIFLLAGQSNMEGAGTVGPQDTLTHPRILTMNKAGDWIYAKEPIHFHTNGNRGLDMGMSFARTLIQSVPKDVSIAIIPSAMGGSAVGQWLSDELYRGQHMWSNLKSKIHAVEKDGTFKGILWHQGESDAKPDRIPKYDESLHELFDRIENETNTKKLPKVVGELGKFKTHRPLWLQFNAELKRISDADPLIEIVGTSDLGDKGDQVHFNGTGQRTMGIRYAKKMAKLLNLKTPVLNASHNMMTYNMRLDLASDKDNNWDHRKEAFVNQINDIYPHIFGIQEGLLHQIEYIKNNLNGFDYIGKARDGETNKEEYCAIFYNTNKYNLISQNTFWLSDTPLKVSQGWDAAYKRICTYGKFEDKMSGKIFLVFNTHLDHKGHKARLKGIRLILAQIKLLNEENNPVIIMGDLNSKPNDTVIITLEENYKNTFIKIRTDNYEPIGTFNGFDLNSKMERLIDYIFVNDQVSIKTYNVERNKEGGRFISDHFPVIVELEF